MGSVEIVKDRQANLEYRATLLDRACRNPGLQAALREQCRADILYWINHFLFIFEPRAELQAAHGSESPHLPFITYPYQDDLVLKYQRHIAKGRDLLNEKSRDMGVTWIALATLLHFWEFGGAGADFLVGSRKEDLVDHLGDMTALLSKLRYLVNRQPAWLKPEGYNRYKHAPFLLLLNPETGATIKGESNNPSFSTSGRYKAIFYDEFARWRHTDEAAWQAGSDASPCKIAVSSSNGKNNHFYHLRAGQAGKIDVVRTHWKQHPHKDRKWYEGEKQRRSPADLAAEVNIDYVASIVGRAYEVYDYNIHVKPVKYSLDEPINLECDFNINPMCWALSQERGGHDYYFDEMVRHETSTEAAVLEFCKRYKNHRMRAVHVYGDATGQSRGRQTMGLASDYDVIEKILKDNDWRVARNVRSKNPPANDRIKALNKRLCDWSEINPDTDRGKSWITIDPQCRMIQESLEQTRLKEGGEEDKSDDIEHMAAAMGYKADYLYPVRDRRIIYHDRFGGGAQTPAAGTRDPGRRLPYRDRLRKVGVNV